MVNILKKDSPRFNGANNDSWKEKMKTHLLCISLGYWILTKNEKMVMEEGQLE